MARLHFDMVSEIQKYAHIEREAQDGMSLDNQFANNISKWWRILI